MGWPAAVGTSLTLINDPFLELVAGLLIEQVGVFLKGLPQDDRKLDVDLFLLESGGDLDARLAV